eukprot:1133775-Amphidinium_carterae.1
MRGDIQLSEWVLPEFVYVLLIVLAPIAVPLVALSLGWCFSGELPPQNPNSKTSEKVTPQKEIHAGH